MRSRHLRRTLFDAFSGAYLAMVFLVAVLQPEMDQMLNLNLDILIFLGFFVVAVGLSFALNSVKSPRWHTLGETLFGSLQVQRFAAPWYRNLASWQLLLLLGVTFVAGLFVTKFSLNELFDPDGFEGAMRLFRGLFHPNLQILPKTVLNIFVTVFMAFIATILALPLAFVLSFFCAKNIMRGPLARIIYHLLRTILNFVRAVEALIWAIIFSVWVGIGPFAGMLALMIHSAASLAKQYSEMIESVSEGPIEAIQATGASPLQTVWFAIVPQVILPYISFTIYRWDINVRMATIIGLVGGGGIGTMLIQYQGQAMWPEVGCIILVIAIVVWAMDQASAVIREALK